MKVYFLMITLEEVSRNTTRMTLGKITKSYRNKILYFLTKDGWHSQQPTIRLQFPDAESYASGVWEIKRERHFTTVRGNLHEVFLTNMSAETQRLGMMLPGIETFKKIEKPLKKKQGSFDFLLIIDGHQTYIEVTTQENTKNAVAMFALRIGRNEDQCRVVLMGRKSCSKKNINGRQELAELLYGSNNRNAFEAWATMDDAVIERIREIDEKLCRSYIV